MEKYFSILRECKLFSRINDNDLAALFTCLGAKVQSFGKKDIIVHEGCAATFFGILLSGAARIEQTDYFGNRSIVSNVEAGETFLESFACAEEEAVPVSVVATEPCEVLFIHSDRVLHTCANGCDFHRQIIFNLVSSLAAKNIFFHQRAEITAKRTTREKLLSYLNLMAKKQHSNSFTVPFDRQTLADYLDVDRSGLSAEIGKLKKEGIIFCQKNYFKLL